MANEKSMAKAWVFTINNPTPQDGEGLEKSGYSYYVYGRERGENGTFHFQGYVEFPTRKRLASLKGISERAHWEKRKGTQEQAIAYCKKDGDFVEKGTPATIKQGKRNDLVGVKSLVKEGKPMREIIENCTAANYKFVERYMTLHERKRDWKPIVTWIYGPTGTGKSKRAHETFAGKDYYRKSKGTKWWDGYDAHEYVIIDDFRDSWWSLTEMLDLLDRYATMVECKGGNRQFLAKEIIVTSCMAPGDCYRNTGEAINQLLRRIDETIHLEGPKKAEAELPATGVTESEPEIIVQMPERTPEEIEYAIKINRLAVERINEEIVELQSSIDVVTHEKHTEQCSALTGSVGVPRPALVRDSEPKGSSHCSDTPTYGQADEDTHTRSVQEVCEAVELPAIVRERELAAESGPANELVVVHEVVGNTTATTSRTNENRIIHEKKINFECECYPAPGTKTRWYKRSESIFYSQEVCTCCAGVLKKIDCGEIYDNY